jgi:hypothetical protein
MFTCYWKGDEIKKAGIVGYVVHTGKELDVYVKYFRVLKD